MNRLIMGLALFGVLIPFNVFGAITFTDGKWETTFDCPDWEQHSPTPGSSPDCDGLARYLDTVTTDGSRDHITLGANNSLGSGKGFRHWQGDGNNNHGGGLWVGFPVKQTEFWMRWYHRYEAGFSWSGGQPSYDKVLYIHTDASNIDVIPEYHYDDYVLISQGTPDYYQVVSSHGWSEIQGGSVGDGDYHCFELHIKMDTNSANGVGRLWVDGVLRVENTSVNWSNGNTTARLGWRGLAVGSNQNFPTNGRDMAVDYDDIVIYNTTPPNLDAGGNLFIGPIGWSNPGTFTCYPDIDGDGYGDATDPGTVREVCLETEVTDNTDCDDDDNAINPGETEICGNAVDEDCDGTAQACPGPSVGLKVGGSGRLKIGGSGKLKR